MKKNPFKRLLFSSAIIIGGLSIAIFTPGSVAEAQSLGPIRTEFCTVFLPNERASWNQGNVLGKWANQNPGERNNFNSLADSICAGNSPSVPSFATLHGRALASVAKMALLESSTPPPPPPPAPQCSDGVNNDAGEDSLIDFPNDPGCTSSTDDSESPNPQPHPPPPPPPPGEATHYVSPQGSDSNSGTISAPWRSFQKALDATEPGETTRFLAGTYSVGDCLSGDGGTSGNFATLVADPGVTVEISSGELGIDCPFIRIQGFKFTGPGSASSPIIAGNSSNSHDVEFIGNEVTGAICHGLYLGNSTSNWKILRNLIHDNGQLCQVTEPNPEQGHGIYVQGTNQLIANNVMYNFPTGFGIHAYPRGNTIRVHNNTVVAGGIGGIVIGGSDGVSNAIVVNNIFAFNGGQEIQRDSSAPTSCTIHTNVVFDTSGSSFIESGFPSGCVGANIASNPLFESLSARNLRVQSGSPAVNTGNSSLSFSPAFDGTVRPVGAAVDIGAYER